MNPSEHRSWTRRAFEAVGGSAPRVGLGLFALGSGAFALQGLALGRFGLIADDPTLVSDMRLTLTHIAILAYMMASSVYYEQARDAALLDLRTRFGCNMAGPVGLSGSAILAVVVVGTASAALLSVTLSPGPTSYDPATWSAEVAWHRVLALAIGGATTRLFFLVLVESGRISDRAFALEEIDLLEPERLAPFARIGLTGALLAIGGFSVYALFLIDTGYLPLVGGLFTLAVLVGALALFLPLRGVRQRVQQEKKRELGWCRARMHAARDRLADGRPSGDLEELLAWEARVQATAEWPVDASTLSRFGLYLLIPLGSWAGAALVERLVDSLLD